MQKYVIAFWHFVVILMYFSLLELFAATPPESVDWVKQVEHLFPGIVYSFKITAAVIGVAISTIVTLASIIFTLVWKQVKEHMAERTVTQELILKNQGDLHTAVKEVKDVVGSCRNCNPVTERQFIGGTH